MIFDYLLSIIIKSITSPNMTQFSSHTPESPSKLNSLWWSVLLSSQKWKISFAPRNLFNSRINNRALLLQRLLLIFCSFWRRLLLKDQLFICFCFNFSFICWIIIVIITQYLSHYHFHCHRCSYDNYFYKVKFYFTIIVFIISCILFFFSFFFFFFILIQKIQSEWCGYPSCWLPTIVRFLSHEKFWVWRWRMDASYEDWRQKGAYVY